MNLIYMSYSVHDDILIDDDFENNDAVNHMAVSDIHEVQQMLQRQHNLTATKVDDNP